MKLAYHEKEIEIDNILIDTGSATTILSADELNKIGISPLPEDIIYTIRGVGGIETVFTRMLDYIELDGKRHLKPDVEIGGMDYGFEINGILGMDLLLKLGVVINLRDLIIEFE